MMMHQVATQRVMPSNVTKINAWTIMHALVARPAPSTLLVMMHRGRIPAVMQSNASRINVCFPTPVSVVQLAW